MRHQQISKGALPSRSRRSLRLSASLGGLLLALLAAANATAAIPALPVIPPGLSAAASTRLNRELASVTRDKQRLIAEGDAINRDCRHLRRGSATYNDCLERKSGYDADLQRLRADIASLWRHIGLAHAATIDDLKRQDASLTAAINDDINAIRRMGFNRRAADFAAWQRLGDNARRQYAQAWHSLATGIVVSHAESKMLDVLKRMDNVHLRKLIATLERRNNPNDEAMLKALRQMLRAGRRQRAHMADQARVIASGIERGLQGAAAASREDWLGFWGDSLCDAAEESELLPGCHLLESEGLAVSSALYNNAARRVAIREVERLTTMTERQLIALRHLDALLQKQMTQRNQVRSQLQRLQNQPGAT